MIEDLTMETAVIWLLVGFGVGIYCRGLRAKTAKMQAERQVASLNQQTAMLRREIISMQKAEAQRLQNIARRRQYFEENDVTETENQIRFIGQCDLHAVRPVNKEAVHVLYALDEWIVANQPKWRLSFEVGMGAFIKTQYDPEDRVQKAAFSSYNSKRVDFLLIDRFGHPKIAIEYHGTGHDLSGHAEDRMEVKRLALQRAGIPLVEIPAKTAQPEILRMITEALASDTPPSASLAP